MILHKVSVIIPVLNEAYYLVDTLLNLSVLSSPVYEIIVVDGGSTDGTLEHIQGFDVKIIKCKEAGRALQMNEGAKTASGDYFCFLHADTTVPVDLVQIIIKTLNQPKVVCGGFISVMRGKQEIRWLVSILNYLKTYIFAFVFHPYLFFSKQFRILFGDQAIFCQKQVFWQCGGFNEELPIMEEVDFCHRIVKFGHIKQINRFVESSDRRVAKQGILRSHFIYLWIIFLWAIGASPLYLKKLYKDVR